MWAGADYTSPVTYHQAAGATGQTALCGEDRDVALSIFICHQHSGTASCQDAVTLDERTDALPANN